VTKERILVDDTGRPVTMPTVSALKDIYFTSPLAQVFCYTLAPDLLAGTSMVFDSEQLRYLPKGSDALEFLGSLSQGGIIDVDMLHYKDVQLLFSISGTNLTDVNIDMALDLEKKSRIPVFLIDGSFDRIGSTYRLLGEVLGRRDRAEKLASYCEGIYTKVSSALAAVPSNELVSYLYAEGPEGLLTEPDDSQHSLAFSVARGRNVAAEISLAGRTELVPITTEQILEWDPDFIICGSAGHSAKGYTDEPSAVLRASSAYSDLRAVREDRVFVMPSKPFAFCDRPPGLNRFLGIQWLANLFYPTYYDVDMIDAVCEFYEECYWCTLTREDAAMVLAV
jgi:iron complex transport system substrate-binding protein